MADYLDFFNIYVMGSLEMVMGFWFFTGFLQKKGKIIYSTLFAAFGMSVLTIFNLHGIGSFLVFIILLITAGKLLYRAEFVSAALYAVVTEEILNLCFGLTNSLSYILSLTVFMKNPQIFGFILMGAGNTLALALAFLCYRGVQKCCGCDETIDRKYVFVILMPALLIFLASEYINENIYGNTMTTEREGMLSGVNPYQMLFMQVLGVASLFCILFSYKKLTESFKRSKEAELLELQAHSLNQYVEEAKLRYEKTKSFRHDVKNHITVVKELLQNKKAEAALQYVEEMENLTADISFPVSTNHPVLDILLGNKLGIAEENRIEVQCSLIVPYPCGISDIDFCIILGNALDNALSACKRISNGKEKYIHVAGKVQGDFLLMEIENSFTGRRTIRSGTGLANIRAAVEKYQGAMEIRTEGEKFVLSLLLIIPRQSESTSQQAG
ncbi:MAG: GHKL domain-containing protein [Lachnospiraceae bacterium]|nr:GHKL domain-containing protein [Lachnospiraceae bacterium]